LQVSVANAKDTPARVKQSALSTIAMASTVGTRDLDALELEKARSGCGAPDTSASSPADPPVSLEDAQKEIDRLHEIALKLQRSRSLPGKSKDNAGGEAA